MLFSMRTYPFEACDKFDFNRLYGSEKYGLQNMLLKQYNMPTFVYAGEQTFEVWDDRISTVFWNATKELKSTYNADAFFAGVNDKDFIEWASKVFSEVNGQEVKLTGAAVIRYTNVMSGYPTLRLSGVVATENIDSRPYGITTRRREPELVDTRYGPMGREW